MAQGITAQFRIAKLFDRGKHGEAFISDKNIKRCLIVSMNEGYAERLLEVALDARMHRQWWRSSQPKDSCTMALRPKERPTIVKRRRE